MNAAAMSPPSRPLDLNCHFWQILLCLSREPAFQGLQEVLAEGDGAPNTLPCPAPRLPSPPWDDMATPKAADACPEGAVAGPPSPSRARARSPKGDHLSIRPVSMRALRLVERSGHPRLWEAYSIGLNLFINVREEAGLPSAWPIPGDQMRRFIVSMDLQDFSSPKIFMYTSALCYISRVFQFENPLEDFLTSRALVALSWRRIPKMPLSFEMFRNVIGVFGTFCTDTYECLLFQSVFTLTFIAALRPKEIVVNGPDSMHTGELVCLSDIEIRQDTIGINLRVETGAQRSMLVLAPSTDRSICCVQALRDYLTVRPSSDGPLFIDPTGQPLTRQRFLEVFHSSLSLLGIPPYHYGIKSFHLGSLMSVVKDRYPDRVINILARWPSKDIPQRR